VKQVRLNLLVAAHLLTVIGEWAVIFGVLVHAYRWGGSSTVGLVSLAVLAPPLICAPLAANLTARYRPHTVRIAGFVVQTAAFAAAAMASALGLPTPAVAACVVIGLGAINTLRPTGAALLPVIARSTEELVRGNLRISYCDSAAALIGSLVASSLTGASGPTAVFIGSASCAALAAIATAWRPSPRELAQSGARKAKPPRHLLRVTMIELRERPWAIGVLAVSAARNLVVGAFDMLLVILALSALKMDDRGPGLLSALVGGGAVLSTVVLTLIVRRSQLRYALTGALVVTAMMCAGIGLFTDSPAVFVLLPIAGLCLSLMDNLSRMLLQRSTEPRRLGPLLACMGLVTSVAQLTGALVAQALLALADVRVALLGISLILLFVAGASVRALRNADSHAEIPVIEMALLANVPMFAPLPEAAFEMAARSGQRVHVLPGEEVIHQGEEGDVFYVVVDGDFDIIMNGVLLRTAPAGDFFGEVALLSDMRRTATVRARGAGELLAIHRDPFLMAITGHEASRAAAMDYIVDMDLEEKFRRTGGLNVTGSSGDVG
jgi:MFS family permease